MISKKIVLLLAFVKNGRSIVPTRTLNFAGACAKPFAKIQQLAPTNNSALVNTFSDRRRTCVHCVVVQHNFLPHRGPHEANPSHNRI